MRGRSRGSAAVEYLAAVAAVGLLMLALVAERAHRPERRPPLDPVGYVRALVRPPPRPVRPRPPVVRPAPPRVRPAPARPARPRTTVLAPRWW